MYGFQGGKVNSCGSIIAPLPDIVMGHRDDNRGASENTVETNL